MIVWRRWLAWAQEREDALTMAVVRIAVGVMTMAWVMGLWDGDAVRLAYVDASDGGIFSLHRPRLGVLGSSPAEVHGLLLAAIVAGAALVLGWFPRVAAFIGGQVVLTITMSNTKLISGYDALLTNVLWLLVLSPSAATLSVHAWRQHKQWLTDVTIPSWPRRLIVFQMLAMYFIAGVNKVGVEWLPMGDHAALWYVMHQPLWNRYVLEWPSWIYPITQLGTAVTHTWEVLAPVMLLHFFARRRAARTGRTGPLSRWDWRPAFLLLGATMHLGIELLMEVGIFSWLSVSLYVAFYSGDELKRRVRRVMDARAKRQTVK